MTRSVFLVTAFLVCILVSSIFVFPWIVKNEDGEDFFVGVSFGGDSFFDAKLLIDRVKNFTNLFVVQSGPASKNQTLLDEICDYAVDSGLSIIVYFGKFDLDWQPLWVESGDVKWGSSFLGIYFFDEPAGSLLDSIDEMWNDSLGALPKNYDAMANYFVDSWQTMPGLVTVKEHLGSGLTFTSDYALYWFDFLAGYDVVFAEFGWNHSRVQDVALARGAARVQGKEWGAIVTWTYNDPPYIGSGEELYDDLVYAYDNGAKYFVVFNYPEINEYGILEDEHFLGLEKFWQKVSVDSGHVPVVADTLLVLPKNYGWGMRHVNDTIWGVWKADSKSVQIWDISRSMLSLHGPFLDIVYDGEGFLLEDYYSEIVYWNQTS